MSGKNYSIDFSAANPSLYSRLFPQQISTLPIGRSNNPLINATDSTSVESLAPGNLALGQIVPFEFRISVDNTATVNGNSIVMTAGWETVTTNGSLFGYDSNLGVIAAFVDAGDPNASKDANATVSNFSWKLVGNEIQANIQVANLDPGEEVVVEAWLALKNTIPLGTNGNVQSRLINAKTAGTIQSGETISTGNQTIPLLQVKDFFTTQADLSVKSLATGNNLTQVRYGDRFDYKIVATNNSSTVANQVVLTDNLDPNVKFISAKVTDSQGATTTIKHNGSNAGGIVTGDLSFLNPGETVTIDVTVEVLNTAPIAGTNNLSNTVTIQSINEDSSTSNNTAIEVTDVIDTNNNTNNNSTTPGVFVVDSTGQIKYDYIYDGGWFQGEVAVFNLAGMEAYQYGSVNYIKEAAARALSNSTQGRILTNDNTEGAHFDFKVGWEKNFNQGKYQGAKSFSMNPGDKLGFMMVQNSTFANVYNNPNQTSQWGKKVLFSTDKNQLAAVDNYDTFAFEDVKADSTDSDGDYNDFVFQVTGLTDNVNSMDTVVNPSRDWRDTEMGKQLLHYSSGETFTEGVFKVGKNGNVIIDYLYDGGFYQAEVGIFSLNGMEGYDVNSDAFAAEAINRALSNSKQGYVVTKDPVERARYSDLLKWEGNFNQGNYLGRQTFQMNPGDTFGLVLVPDTTLQDSLLAPKWALKKQPFFSMSAANIDDQKQIGTVYDGSEGAIVGWEDVPHDRGSNLDYNDIVLAIEGADAIGMSPIEDLINGSRNWLDREVGQEIANYFDTFASI